MVNITLFEFHLGDADFTANAWMGDEETAGEIAGDLEGGSGSDATGDDGQDESDNGGLPLIAKALVVSLLVTVAVYAVARYFSSGQPEVAIETAEDRE